jgi:tryptophan halogenase
MNIVIAGGGTAGWITALYVKTKLPEADVKLVESEEIGILGAGEGTTPTFINFLDSVGIPFSRLIQHTSTTVKNGIKFTNWKNNSSHYYHGFLSSGEVGFNAFDNADTLPETSLLTVVNQGEGYPLSEINFLEIFGEKGKVGFELHPEYSGQPISDPIFKYLMHSHYAAHFDAAKIADLLKEIATSERGIERVEGKIVKVNQSETGDVSEIVLESGEVISVDFIFDCTGFSRKIIGELYSSKWVSHQDRLTVNAAIPFFLPIDSSIPAYTESLAMKYGWMWKIPLQHRYGCGYVFDSNIISPDDAKKEVDDLLGFEVESPRTLKFTAGYYETPWIKNCIAIGLSGGFIEPLEATSIWVSILTLKNSLDNLDIFLVRDQKSIDEFNKKFVSMNSQIMRFIYLHYMSGREDTDFWKPYQKVERAPEDLQLLLSTWSHRAPEYRDFQGQMFPLESWISVAEGVGRLNTEVHKRTYENNKIFDLVGDSYRMFKNNQKDVASRCSDHKKFLEDLK